MGLLIRIIELLLVLVPLIGVIAAGIRAISALSRRAGAADAAPEQSSGSAERQKGRQAGTAAQWQAIRRGIDAHQRTDARWLEYELDASRLLDFPVMTDMREQLTTRFHKARLRADLYRPLRAEDLLDDPEAAARYLDAVEDYVAAFDTAEAEAMRRRRSDFSTDEQQRLARAQSLLRVAADAAATAPERQRAYGLARAELEGLIVLPDTTRSRIERGIAGEIGG